MQPDDKTAGRVGFVFNRCKIFTGVYIYYAKYWDCEMAAGKGIGKESKKGEREKIAKQHGALKLHFFGF